MVAADVLISLLGSFTTFWSTTFSFLLGSQCLLSPRLIITKFSTHDGDTWLSQLRSSKDRRRYAIDVYFTMTESNFPPPGMDSNLNKADLYKNVKQSECYSKYRLSAPQMILDKIMSYLSEKLASPHQHALDVGCGTGQSTRILAPYFANVTGTDVSETQLFEARRHPETSKNILYKLAPAESLPFEQNSLQLITASTCVHWFDKEKFLEASKEMLQDNGVLAIYSVRRPYIKGTTEEQTEKIRSVIDDTDEHFRKNSFPRKNTNWRHLHGGDVYYDLLSSALKDTVLYDDLSYETELPLSTVIGHIRSNPGYRFLAEKEGEESARNILAKLKAEILQELNLEVDENDDMTVTVIRKCTLVMGRK